DRERRLRTAGAAVRARAEPVRPYSVGPHVEGVPAVGTGDQHGGDPFDRPLDVGAGVEHEPGIETGKVAIAVGTDPDLHGRARRGVRPGDVLAAVEGQ